MRYFLQFFVFQTALFIFAPPLIFACSCARGGEPCQIFWNTDAVFSGEVKQINVVPAKEMSGGREFTYEKKKVLLKINEAFRGISGDTVELETGMGGSDCGYDFQVGQSYLVYAHKNLQTGELGTSICTRTRLLAKATEDLAYLRGLPDAPLGATISGNIFQTFASLQNEVRKPAVPLTGIPVTIAGNLFQAQTLTDEKGNFQIPNVAGGEYQLSLKIPENLGGYEKPIKIKVFDKGCLKLGFSLQIKTELSGRLFDEKAMPASNVEISMIPVTQLNNPSLTDIIFNGTDADGRFIFRWIPPGKYYLGVRFTSFSNQIFPYPQTYYPGTINLAEAKPIDISEGQILENVDFKLPVKNRLRTISGVVLYPDGTPVANADLAANETQYFYSHYFFQAARTKADGTFSFQIIDGVKYDLGAWVNLPHYEQRHAKTIELPQNGDVSNLRFIISEPGGV